MEDEKRKSRITKWRMRRGSAGLANGRGEEEEQDEQMEEEESEQRNKRRSWRW
jgi:hypothetical protein